MWWLVILSFIFGAVLQWCGDILSKQYDPTERAKRSMLDAPRLAVMLGAGSLAWLAIDMWGVTWLAGAAMVFFYGLVVLTIVDVRLQLLPDVVTYPLIIMGVSVNYYGGFVDVQSAAIGAFAGFLSLWSVNTVFRLVRGKNGMGAGDFKLFAAIGAWIGWPLLPLVIMMSSVVGLVVIVVGTVLGGKDLSRKIPFGPYLAGAGLIAMCFGNNILLWYVALYQ